MMYRKYSKRQLLAMTWWNRPKYKMLDAIICDGAVRSGKTVCMADGFFIWSMSCFSGCNFALCGRSISSLRRNVVDNLSAWLGGLFTIRENGVYSAGAEGISGFDPVTVEVDVTSAFEAGKQTEYDRFWDAFQYFGNRKHYQYAFNSRGWTDETFQPKYNIVPDSANYMFAGCGIVDLIGCLEKSGVVMDLSECISFQYMMRDSVQIKHFPTIDLRAATSFLDGFRYAGNLESGSFINVTPEIQWSNSFANCTNLKELSFSGTIGKAISFAQSGKLSDASIQSIIDALGDLSGTATQTLTFHKEVGARLSVEQKALITAKNWTLVY